MADYTDLKLPDRVWAWGSELMGEWDLDPTGGTEYIRADIHAAAIKALEAEVARKDAAIKQALDESVADDMDEWYADLSAALTPR